MESGEKHVSDGGEAFLELLAHEQIDYLFFNPGSDYYPVLEHMSNFEVNKRPRPKPILCLSEHLALAMAHGYSMVTQRAQVVMVHVGLGTMQLGGAMHNAYRGRAPVLIVAGRSPFTFEGELAGGRDKPYHWDQEVFDQSGLFREYTKWSYELKTNLNLHHVVKRALQVANSEPQGTAYLVLPRELLAEKVQTIKLLPNRWAAPTFPSAPLESLERIAKILTEAQNPVIITEYLGKNPSAVQKLVELAELLGAPIIEASRKRMNFPTRHPLYLKGVPKDVISNTDVLLLLDVDVPWSPVLHKLRSDVRVLQIDIDAVKSGMPLWGFPVDIGVSASTLESLPALIDLIGKRVLASKDLEQKASERRKSTKKLGDSLRRELLEQASRTSSKDKLNVYALVEALNNAKEENAIIMNEAASDKRTVENYIDSSLAGTFFSSGGSSLGDGMGNALGLKLASPASDVICITGDGGYVYSNPTAVLWTAMKFKIPTLNVIINNAGYAAMKGAVSKNYPEGWSAKNDVYSGVDFEPSPDYVAIAKACGAVGWKVNTLSDFVSTIPLALKHTREGKAAVIDAVVS